MAKPATPAVWASGKSFGFQPSASQQAQGFDYIATVRPGTGAPITDDHDFPLKQITSAVAWIMGSGSDGMLPKRSFAVNDYIRVPDEPGGLIIQWFSAQSVDMSTTTVTLPVAFPNAILHVSASGYNVSGGAQTSVTCNSPGNSRSIVEFNAFFADTPGKVLALAKTNEVRIQGIAIGY